MRVGIIGGGIAGLMAAWLLEEECEVIVFEKSDYLGGHARTTYIDADNMRIPIESGFEFFNKGMFPHLWHLLQLLHVPTRTYPFTYTFFTQNNSPIVLPPIQGTTIFWGSLALSGLRKIFQLKKMMNKSRMIIAEKNTAITLEEFCNDLKLSADFQDNFFFPLFCAGWGVTPEEFKQFAAYNILCWMVQNQPMGFGASYWSEMVNGVSSYIDVLVAQIQRAKIMQEVDVSSISHDGTAYHIAMQNNEPIVVDHLVCATNAFTARDLLKDISHAQAVCSILGAIRYVHATIAVHTDQRFMPPNQRHWSIANVWHQDGQSALTIHKHWKSKMPYFRSWLLPGFSEPEQCYSKEYYYHAKPDVAYYVAQKELEGLQGENNLWFSGIYTHDIDSHESAIVSAINIANQLVPQSRRLATITNL